MLGVQAKVRKEEKKKKFKGKEIKPLHVRRRVT
jgi:hypothetical protein